MKDKPDNYYDVVLISPPSRMINHYRPPLALMYVGGYLRKMGMSVKIIDIPMKEVIRDKRFDLNKGEYLKDIQEQMVGEFRGIKTRVVGITFYTPEYFEVFDLARAFKEIDPKVKVVVGGIHPTLYPEEIFAEKDCPIDFAVVGEGEVTAFELVRAILSGGKDYSKILGIAYWDKNFGGVVKTGLRPVVENLDEISEPAYDLIDMDYYTQASPYAVRGVFIRSMYMMATRGCPSQCTFCVAKKLRVHNGGGKYSRVRSASSLIEELTELKDLYSIDGFYFIDDLFTVNKPNVIDFCNQIKKEKMKVFWGCSSKVSTLNEEVIKNMAEAGCVQIDFGIERGSNKALNLIKKGINVDMVRKVFTLCHRYGIRTFANFLVNLPGETEEDLDDILNFLDELEPDIVSLNIFAPYPGTEIYDDMPYKFHKDEYPGLSDTSTLIYTYPEKFKFSKHSVNLVDWVCKYQRVYNKIRGTVKFYLNARYWGMVFKSGKRWDYLTQSTLLFREFINQKL